MQVTRVTPGQPAPSFLQRTLGRCATVVATPGAGRTPMVLKQDDAPFRRMAIGRYDGLEAYARCMRARGGSARVEGGGAAPSNCVVAASNSPPRPYSPLSNRAGSLGQVPGAKAGESSLNDSRYASLLDQFVAQGSKSWAMNKYDPASMKSTASISQSANGTHLPVVGHYSYNRGQPGWVQGGIFEGKLSRLRYRDFPNDRGHWVREWAQNLEALAVQMEAQSRNQDTTARSRAHPLTTTSAGFV